MGNKTKERRKDEEGFEEGKASCRPPRCDGKSCYALHADDARVEKDSVNNCQSSCHRRLLGGAKSCEDGPIKSNL